MLKSEKGSIPVLLLIIVVVLVVGVGGYFYSQQKTINKQASITTLLQPSVSSPTPVPLDETANWKTYENKDQYELKYPASLSIREDSETDFSNVTFLFELDENKTNTATINIVADKIPTETSLKDAIRQNPSAINGTSVDDYEFNSIKIGGEDGIYSVSKIPAYNYAYVAFVIHKTMLYSFRLDIATATDPEVKKEIFFKILSTFKFLN